MPSKKSFRLFPHQGRGLMAPQSLPFPAPETPAPVPPDMPLPHCNPMLQMLAFAGIPARLAGGVGRRFAAGVRRRVVGRTPCAGRQVFFRCGAEGQCAATRQKGQQR
jgi:hypothetical protein